jgi:nucleotide-binding universal stress UspA family protein
MKILLAVDGSPYTKKMLAYLVTHSLFTEGNTFEVLNVQPELPPHARASVGKEVVHDYYLDEAEKVLAPVSEFLLRHGINAKTSWKCGHAGETIAALAESEKYDLVMMGSQGHGTLVNLVMGSVTTEVLKQCKVPVLLIR